MRVCCISDTHTKHKHVQIPECDLLVFAGDFSGNGKIKELLSFAEWVSSLDIPSIVVAGNHDFIAEQQDIRSYFRGNVRYLQDDQCYFGGLKFYGSPWQPEFCNWAFNLPRGEQLARKWSMIPDDVDVLITHGGPAGILSTTNEGLDVGCYDLRRRIEELSNLKLHVFGHIHEAYGQENGIDNCRFVNASICDLGYRPVNQPIVVEI